jgi:hypothetical protein
MCVVELVVACCEAQFCICRQRARPSAKMAALGSSDALSVLVPVFRSTRDHTSELAAISYHMPTCKLVNHWVMHPVARVSTNIYRNLRTQQMSVIVLLCTSYTTCFGPYWWPSSGGFVTKTSNAVTVCQWIRCFSMLICKLDVNI